MSTQGTGNKLQTELINIQAAKLSSQITKKKLGWPALLCEDKFQCWWRCSNAAFSFGALGQDWEQSFNLTNYLKVIASTNNI